MRIKKWKENVMKSTIVLTAVALSLNAIYSLCSAGVIPVTIDAQVYANANAPGIDISDFNENTGHNYASASAYINEMVIIEWITPEEPIMELNEGNANSFIHCYNEDGNAKISSGVNTWGYGLPSSGYTHTIVEQSFLNIGTNIEHPIGTELQLDISFVITGWAPPGKLSLFRGEQEFSFTPPLPDTGQDWSESITVYAGESLNVDFQNWGDMPMSDANITFEAVPEPATLSLLALGVIALARRKK